MRLHPLLPPGTALVRCRPFTGRTHQIRVHLSLLGHPIANDAAYGGAHPGDRARGEELVRLCARLVIGDEEKKKKKENKSKSNESADDGGVHGSGEIRCVVVAGGPTPTRDGTEGVEGVEGVDGVDGEGEGFSSPEWPLCAHCPRIVHGVEGHGIQGANQGDRGGDGGKQGGK